MDGDVEAAAHYRSPNFVVTCLVNDELEGVAKVVDVAMEAEVVCH